MRVDVRDSILNGMDTITDTSSPALKARWAREVVNRMDEALDADTRVKVREGCAA